MQYFNVGGNIMKLSFQGTIALFWIVFWTARILADYDRYIMTENGKLFLLLYFIAIGIGVFFVLYLGIRRYGQKLLAKTSKQRFCPECYAYIGKEKEFCPKCGANLKGSGVAIYCAYCNTQIFDTERMFCPKCGRELRK